MKTFFGIAVAALTLGAAPTFATDPVSGGNQMPTVNPTYAESAGSWQYSSFFGNASTFGQSFNNGDNVLDRGTFGESDTVLNIVGQTTIDTCQQGCDAFKSVVTIDGGAYQRNAGFIQTGGGYSENGSLSQVSLEFGGDSHILRYYGNTTSAGDQ